MTDQREDGMWVCSECLSTYESEKALVFCCNSEWDKPSFVRSYD